MPDIEPATPTQPASAELQRGKPPFAELPRGRRVPLMTEVAIVTTLALIAAPIVLVAGTLAAAAKKRLSQRREPEAVIAGPPSRKHRDRAGGLP